MTLDDYLSDEFDFAIYSPKNDFQGEILFPRKPSAVQQIVFKAESKVAIHDTFNKLSVFDIKALHHELIDFSDSIAPNY